MRHEVCKFTLLGYQGDVNANILGVVAVSTSQVPDFEGSSPGGTNRKCCKISNPELMLV